MTQWTKYPSRSQARLSSSPKFVFVMPEREERDSASLEGIPARSAMGSRGNQEREPVNEKLGRVCYAAKDRSFEGHGP